MFEGKYMTQKKEKKREMTVPGGENFNAGKISLGIYYFRKWYRVRDAYICTYVVRWSSLTRLHQAAAATFVFVSHFDRFVLLQFIRNGLYQ